MDAHHDPRPDGLAFDHLVIGVRDLGAAVDRCERDLGFTVVPGGRHTGKGTHNALVVLRRGYLELIAPFDTEEARAANRGGLVDYLDHHGGGFVAYALETTDIEGLARRMAGAGLDATGPFAMRRAQPDGATVSWRLLVPGGSQYRQWWPFFIEWDAVRSVRFGTATPGGAHRNGADAVHEITVAVRDLDRAVTVSAAAFGLVPERHGEWRGDRPELAARFVRYRVAGTLLTFVSPRGPGALADFVDSEGEGPYEIVLSTANAGRVVVRPSMVREPPRE